LHVFFLFLDKTSFNVFKELRQPFYLSKTLQETFSNCRKKRISIQFFLISVNWVT